MPLLLLLFTLAQSPAPSPVTTGSAAPVIEYQNHRVVLDKATWATLPRTKMPASDHGTPTTFEGVSLRLLLKMVEAPLGEALRGEALRLVVRVEAADGYQAVFALAEFDEAFRDKPVILADMRDGKPLFPQTGPFQLAVGDEVRAARWVRQVNRIVVMPVK